MNPIEKTGSKGEHFISLENLLAKFHFQNKKFNNVFVTFTLLLFD